MEMKKLLGIFPIIAGVIAVVGTFLAVTVINALILEITVACTGRIRGAEALGFATLGSLASLDPQALIPLVFGYIIIGLSAAVAILGIIQLVKEDAKAIVIVNLILGIALAVLVILEHIIISQFPSALGSSITILLLSSTIALVLGMATVSPGIGFYLILIGAIIVIAIEIVALILDKRSETV